MSELPDALNTVELASHEIIANAIFARAASMSVKQIEANLVKFKNRFENSYSMAELCRFPLYKLTCQQLALIRNSHKLVKK